MSGLSDGNQEMDVQMHYRHGLFADNLYSSARGFIFEEKWQVMAE
jgi:hypothetical protein